MEFKTFILVEKIFKPTSVRDAQKMIENVYYEKFMYVFQIFFHGNKILILFHCKILKVSWYKTLDVKALL